MSKSVAAAATSVRAKALANSKVLGKKDKHNQPADEAQPAHDAAPTHLAPAHETAVLAATEGSLEGDFSFAQVLADAASSEATFYADAGGASLAGMSSFLQDDGSDGGSDGGAGSTILLVGAVGLVGLGVAVAAGGGNGDGNGGNDNTPPTATANVKIDMDEDTTKTGTVGATDADGDTLTYTVSTAATKGTASVDAAGKYTYTPNKDYFGADSFTITVKDPDGASVTQKVDVTIKDVAEGPTTADVAVNAAGSVTDADNVNTTYTVTLGNYTYTIAGFDINDADGGDKIRSVAGSPVATLENQSFTDGQVTIQYAAGGQVASIVLTGLTNAQDGALFGTADLNTVFGAGTFA